MKQKMKSIFRRKVNKAIAIMLSMAIVLSMVPNLSLTAKAESTVWDGTTKAVIPDGDVYSVSNGAELAWIAEQVNSGNNFSGKTINLTADIVLNSGTIDASSKYVHGWAAIGNRYGGMHPFWGTFDGNNHTVSGVYINLPGTQEQGLFGISKGTIKNVGVINSYIKGSTMVGGIVGNNLGGAVTNCYNTGAVYCAQSAGQAGGIAGYMTWSATGPTVTNCYNAGFINGTNHIGGITGWNEGNVTNCYNIGDTSGNSNTGGVVGMNFGGVTNCYNTGAVNGTSNFGGIIGSNSGAVTKSSYYYGCNVGIGGSGASQDGTTPFVKINDNPLDPGKTTTINEQTTSALNTAWSNAFGADFDVSYPGTYTSSDTGKVTVSGTTITGVSGGTPTISGRIMTIKQNELTSSGFTGATKTMNIPISMPLTVNPDTVSPTAEINVNGNIWSSFDNTVAFKLFFKENEIVSVTASDVGSGVKKIEYLLSNTKFDTQEAVTGAWTDITSAKQFSIAPNSKQYIYVRVTDNAGNVSIINTDGVVLYTDSSTTAADITFAKNGSTDKSTQVTLNGNAVKEIKNGSDVINSSNYTVGTDGTIAFKATYLNSLAVGNYALTVSYNPMGETYCEKTGNEAPATTAINLIIQKSDGEVKNISNIGKTYDGTAVSAPTYDKSGTGAASIEYKVKDADDSTYTTTAPKNAGNYTVRISVEADGNYKAASVTAEFSIAQKEVTISGVTVAATKEYDGNATAAIQNNGTLSANYDGGNLNFTVGTAAYNDKTAATGKTVTFTGFGLTGSAKDNYKLAAQPANTTANITAKGLTVDVSVKDKQYNGKNDAEFNGIPALEGVISGDKVNLTNGTPTFASTAAADNIAIDFTAFAISGEDAGNYTLTQPTGITASIKNYVATKGVAYSVNSNDWLNADFVVTAKTGFQLSTSDTAAGTWSDMLNASEETANGNLEFYVKNTATGVISDKVTENYKIDKTAPTGTQITFTTNSVKNILHAITFGLFFNDTTDVTVSATDSLSGIQQYEYQLVSDDVDNVNGHWNTCDGSFSIDPQFKGVIYARAVDNAGNKSNVITSDKFVVDKQTPTAPIIVATVGGNTYNSGWTSGNVELKASGSSALSGIDHYEYKIGDSGTWTAMPEQSGTNDSTTENAIGDMLTITSNMNNTVHMRAVSNSGVPGNESTITVRKDSVTPSLNVAVSGTTGQWTQDPVTFILSNTANNVSPVTYWVKIGSDNWMQLSGNSCKVSENANTTYQFRAVSASGLTSTMSDAYTVKLTSDALNEVIKDIDDLPDPNNAPDKQITDNEQSIKDTKILYDMLSKDEQSIVGQSRIEKLNKLISRLNALLVIIPKDASTGITAGNIGTSVNLPELNDPGVGKVVVKLAVNPIASTNTQSANIAIAVQSLGQSGTNLVAAFDISLIKTVFDSIGNQTSTGKVSNSNIKGPITIRIPVPAGYQGRTDLRVVYIDNSANVTHLATTLVTIDGVQYLQFTTTHFSVYAVTAPEQKSPVHNPETGDNCNRFPMNAIPFIGLAVLSLSRRTVFFSKKKLSKHGESYSG